MSSAPAAPADTPRASAETIAASLRDAIVRRRLAPGAKLVEDEIAALFGVGRTIVRTALQALAREGIVVIRRHRGARVAHPSPAEARGIFEARALVEPHLAARAAARIGPAGTGRLRAVLAREHEALAADRISEAVWLSAEFHLVLADIADHPVLAGILSDLLARSSLVVALYGRRPDPHGENHAHGGLISALERGEGALAARQMAAHLADLLAGLDLAEHPRRGSSLADALRP